MTTAELVAMVQDVARRTGRTEAEVWGLTLQAFAAWVRR
jgi:hypothetical protein